MPVTYNDTRYGLEKIYFDTAKDRLVIQSPEGLGQLTCYIDKVDLLEGSVRILLLNPDDTPHFDYSKDEGRQSQIMIYTTADWITQADDWVGYSQPLPYAEIEFRRGRYVITLVDPSQPKIFFEHIQVGIRIHLIADAETSVTIRKNGCIELRGSDEFLRSIREGTMREATH